MDDVARMRPEDISFFLVVLLGSAFLLQRMWNRLTGWIQFLARNLDTITVHWAALAMAIPQTDSCGSKCKK